MLDTQMVFLKEFFEKNDFEKNQQTTKKHEKFPKGQSVKHVRLLKNKMTNNDPRYNPFS